MIPSVEGLLVAMVLLMVGAFFRAPLLVALPLSLAFGATAFCTLTFLGGSSPLIFSLLSAMLVLRAAVTRSTISELGKVLASQPNAWTVAALGFYAAATAIILPRLFAGQTTAFVVSRSEGGLIVEVPLEPVTSNISQTGYLLLGIGSFFALSALLTDERRLRQIRVGMFAFVVANALLGVLDLLAKGSGAGDLLAPIRSANYVMLTNAMEAGFVRVAGGFSEASAFGATTLACLAFSYTYWRYTNSRKVLALTLASLALLLLSTSSTAYVGLAAFVAVVGFSMLRQAVVGRLTLQDLGLLAAGLVGVAAIGAIYLYDDRTLDPFTQLFETTLLKKATSASGIERAHWNTRSLQSFMDTTGLGVGFGSSRASSWIVAVISQLGVVGASLMLLLVADTARPVASSRPEHQPLVALAAACRAAALAWLTALSIGGGSPDPGQIFFICLAVIQACRMRMDAAPRSAEPRLQVIQGGAGLQPGLAT